MNCKSFQTQLPDLVLNPAIPPQEASKHLADCLPCAREYNSLIATMAAMDAWTAPQTSPYFDQKLAVMLREEAAMPKLGFFGKLREHLLFNTGRQFRPAVAAAMVLVLMLGGGGYASLENASHAGGPAQVSTTLTDLQRLDKNEQTLQQMDQLLQDEDSNDDSGANAPS